MCGRICWPKQHCKACSQSSPCRSWCFEGGCNHPTCKFPHPSFYLPGAEECGALPGLSGRACLRVEVSSQAAGAQCRTACTPPLLAGALTCSRLAVPCCAAGVKPALDAEGKTSDGREVIVLPPPGTWPAVEVVRMKREARPLQALAPQQQQHRWVAAVGFAALETSGLPREALQAAAAAPPAAPCVNYLTPCAAASAAAAPQD